MKKNLILALLFTLLLVACDKKQPKPQEPIAVCESYTDFGQQIAALRKWSALTVEWFEPAMAQSFVVLSPNWTEDPSRWSTKDASLFLDIHVCAILNGAKKDPLKETPTSFELVASNGDLVKVTRVNAKLCSVVVTFKNPTTEQKFFVLFLGPRET